MISNSKGKKQINQVYKRSGIYIISILSLFVLIGILTTAKPAYRISSQMITEWTSDMDSSIFLYLLGLENRAFQQAYPEDKTIPKPTTALFHIATNIKPDDPRSLLGKELPGFSLFDSRVLIAGEGTNYTNLPIESSPPLEEVLKEREAVLDEESEEAKEKDDKTKNDGKPTTGDKEVVYIYNSHNRESFLPHLPGVTDPDLAHHKEVNITKVSDRLAASLEAEGIGATVDNTDIMSILNDKGWGYGQSYKASRDVVKEAFATNKDIKFAFDLHRDSIQGEATTKKIDGKNYARIMIVIGAEHKDYEKNLALATKLHYKLEDKYPGLSRGVYPKKGPGVNGIYNQDLSENLLVLEMGGVDNHLEELYRSADALAEVFSEFYWDAEKVNSDS
ncbi:stage II sporulation protein P [Virgibacillus halodenitrificans]|jgi:stage II sporulation protein P|uniref:Stage II sporulation protein P n=1 Tax=Virgibacillus halodenitrificans TaxID=1482 RepID=A0AAC9IZA8_VIRHA|nr:stage II sporulation protein P [Virgibacillus halodenitrificans]APC48208.1 stage II sporulation protein P [Virgibacillus halodenitrificans]MBD1222853.1 stage II sporulation protein P [Virgibacillus halodenitrificans]MCJ0930809.1 stage II sporulation protein P [Virgibacillus halodenitrificans]MEC2160040.1 stage II sporulation protein P [Virgibacillus halodenitrificans]MYL59581.1 stage II sporulation protein P [Virgibacillus halodenitrificans]